MRVQPSNLRHLSPSSASAQLRLQGRSPPSLFSAPARRVPRTRQEDVPESVRTTSRPLFCSLNSDPGVQPCLAISTFHFLIPMLGYTFQERFLPCKAYLLNKTEFLEKEIFLVEQSSSFFCSCSTVVTLRDLCRHCRVIERFQTKTRRFRRRQRTYTVAHHGFFK